jgi:hypothetical protein
VTRRVYRYLKRQTSEHPAQLVFLIAVTLRLSLALVVSIRYGGTLFSDDRVYLNMVKAYTSGQTETWDSYQDMLWGRSLSFLVPASIVYKVTFRSTFAILTLSAIIGSVIPSATTHLLRKYVSVKICCAVGIVMALMPSQVLWSSLFLKDVYIVVGLISTAFILKYWASQIGVSRFLIGLMGVVAVLFYIQRIRLHSLIVVCIALFLSTIFMGGRFWWARAASTAILFSIMPWMIGGGVFGTNFAQQLGNGLEGQRAAGAIGAATGVIELPPPTVSPSSNSNSSVPSSSPIVEELKYLPLGLKVMLLDPTPSQLSRSRSLYLAFAEHLIWYPALMLCFYGVIRRRKWTADLIFAGFLGIGLCSMWALAEGNFGTAFRHRTEFVWIVFLFAGIGLQQLVDDKKSWNVRHSLLVKS